MHLLPDDIHDQELSSHVHPQQWVNPTAAPRYNLVVIGAGTAGLITAAGAAGLGAKVALIERDFMGGDCLNVGCVPSKALLRAARAAADVRDAGPLGVEVPAGTRVNFPAVMERLRRLRAAISKTDSAERYRALGVDLFFGQAQFTGPDTIAVGGQTLSFRKAVLATGTHAARPDVPGLAEVGFHTNETIFTLTELPPRLAVLGAGPVGCELAQALARCGSQVTLVSTTGQILPREDVDAVQILQQSLKRDGLRIWTASHAVGASSRGAEKVLQVQRAGGSEELVVDTILVGVGRVPNVEGLNLEAAGVAYDSREGIHVDDHLRTANRRIYAAGDCCSRYKFTHVADAFARLAIRNALFLGRARVSDLLIPWCTYTDPEIAHVGLYEHEATERDIKVQNFVQPLAHVDRAILDGETDGFVKMHVLAGTDRILGATVVARHAGEMISEITLAMAARKGLGALTNVIHPYPTQAEAIRKVADAYNRTRLTPWVKWLFGKWLAWRR